MGIVEKIAEVKEKISAACATSGRLASSVRLIVVTKTHPAEIAQAVIDAGVEDIGENRVQEILAKGPVLHGNHTVHLIGHLQSNKIGKVLPLVQWIQSIDSVRLVEGINLRGSSLGRKIDALIEVNTSGETSKSGCSAEDCRALCECVAASAVLRLRGLMTIGPLGGDEKQVRGAFASLRRLGESIQDLTKDYPLELSMGMSGDFAWAIEEGSTMVRVGTAILGER